MRPKKKKKLFWVVETGSVGSGLGAPAEDDSAGEQHFLAPSLRRHTHTPGLRSVSLPPVSAP